MNGLIPLPKLADIDFIGGLALGIVSAAGVILTLIVAVSGGVIA